MIKDGRQASPTLEGIREDHLRRYEFALQFAIGRGLKSVADIGCGTGYGSYILARGISKVLGYEIDADAVAFGNQHYAHPNITRFVGDLRTVQVSEVDAAIAFEVIEHLPNPMVLLQQLQAKYLIGSVPNQNAIPFNPAHNERHFRHYTPGETVADLKDSGWGVVQIGSQAGKKGAASLLHWNRTDGRTLVFVASRGA